jgi:hypothetical protein
MNTVDFVVPKKGKSKSVPPTEPPKDPVDAYQGITLNFGKYSGKQLKDVAAEDPKYLKWLKQRFEKDENATPTMKAIIKFANSV